MEIAVKDNVKYLPHKYKNEVELENLWMNKGIKIIWKL